MNLLLQLSFLMSFIKEQTEKKIAKSFQRDCRVGEMLTYKKCLLVKDVSVNGLSTPESDFFR